MSPPEEVFSFGPMRLFTRSKVLLEGDTPVRLGGRAMDLLLALLERAPEVVTKAELETRVWPRSVVETSSLRVQIGALRRALGEGGDHGGFEGRYIANVPGRGYSFVAPVSRYLVPDASGSAARSPEPGGRDDASSGEAEPGARFQPPPRLTRTIGRDEVIATVCQLLSQHRMVTLAGTGGIGKTTLAVAVAERCLASSPDLPVHFVDLSTGHGDGGCVAALIGTALRVPLTAVPPAGADPLPEQLRGRQGLLILDNCEHVLDVVAPLVARLRDCGPALQVLATSREALRVAGERVYRLEPLRVPPPGVLMDARTAMGYPSVALLVERATAQSADFELTDADANLAGALCRRLDGLPLAIEMAAARVGVLGLRDLAERLSDRIGLLHGGRSTTPRHQTLQSLVDWSHAQLPASHQAVWQAMSVFAGPFTLEAASAVMGADADQHDAEDPVVVQIVIDLAEKSLLMPDFNGEQVVYRLLETSRHYAAARLLEQPGRHAVRARHLRWLLRVLARAEERWTGSRRADWLSVHAPLWDEVQVALNWALGEGGDVLLAADLAQAALHLAQQLSAHERFRQPLDRVHERLALLGEAEPLRRLRVAVALTICLGLSGASSVAAQPVHRAARDAAAALHDRAYEIELAYAMFFGHFIAGDYRPARVHAERMVELSAALGDEASLLVGRRILMQSAHHLGDHAVARDLAQTVLRTDRRRARVNGFWIDPADRQVSVRVVLAREAWMAGQSDEARRLLHEALARAAEDVHTLQAHALATAALPIALWSGDIAAARRWSEELRGVAGRHGLSHWLRWAQTVDAVLDGRPVHSPRPEDPALADLLCTLSPDHVDLSSVHRVEDGLVGWCAPEVLRGWGERLLREGVSEEAPRWFERARELARGRGATAWELRALLSLARVDPGRWSAELAALARHWPAASAEADVVAARALLGELSPSAPGPRSDSPARAGGRRSARGSTARPD